jgi:hypothetical protein
MYETNVNSKKEKLIAIGIGVLFMFIALILQGAVQLIPGIYYILKYGVTDGVNILAKLELSDIIIYSFFIGGTAAIFQEGLKFISVDTRPKELAIWIGLGFSIVDIIILYGEAVPTIIKGVYALIIVEFALNTISSLLFHPGTAMLLKYGQLVSKKILYFVIAFLLHFIIDSGVVLTDSIILGKPSLDIEVSAIFWSIAMVISFSTFVIGSIQIRKLKNNKQIEISTNLAN